MAILPQSVWGSISNPATFTDADPIGTGPYTLGSFTPQGFTLVKNPNYWQASKVQVPKVYFPVYTSNTGALSALFAGQIDWTGNYIPSLQRDFVDTNPADHHYWEAAGSSNALWPNLNVWPTNQLPVRQAIDLAINRTGDRRRGRVRPRVPADQRVRHHPADVPGLGRPGRRRHRLRHRRRRPQAKSVLDARRATRWTATGSSQMDGRTLALNLVDPSSYTDYAQDDALIAQQLRAAGIDVTFVGQSVNAWNADVADGNFQLTLHWGSGGVTPYNLYDNWLDDSLVSSTGATGDFERLKDPTIESDLAALSAAPDVAAQTAALAPIAKYVAAQPAGHPDHHRGRLVRVQLAELRRLADPGQPLRQRRALGHRQRPGHRQRRGRAPAPHPGRLKKKRINQRPAPHPIAMACPVPTGQAVAFSSERYPGVLSAVHVTGPVVRQLSARSRNKRVCRG